VEAAVQRAMHMNATVAVVGYSAKQPRERWHNCINPQTCAKANGAMQERCSPFSFIYIYRRS